MMNYSVLMSVYIEEDSEYFTLSVDSMLNQTVRPDEIILVKDGPLTDALNNHINAYVERYPNLFNIVELQENVGLGLALNAGLQASRNNLVARMDTDDIALPTRCEKQLKEFEKNPKLSIVGTNTNEFSTDPSDILSSRVVPEEHEDVVRFSKTRNPFNHPTVMYKRDDVLESGGYGDFRRNQDYELFVRMLTEGYLSKNIQEPLLLFRANEDNLKRRKSWNKTRGDISIRYNFWKQGYIGFSDYFISTVGFLGAYMTPNWLFKKLSDNFLRKKNQ